MSMPNGQLEEENYEKVQPMKLKVLLATKWLMEIPSNKWHNVNERLNPIAQNVMHNIDQEDAFEACSEQSHPQALAIVPSSLGPAPGTPGLPRSHNKWMQGSCSF